MTRLTDLQIEQLSIDLLNERERVAVLARGRDAAYRERNQLVRFLACLFPSGTAKTHIEGWDEEWQNCVYIDTPEGQMSWHFHDSDKPLFATLPHYSGQWDGHTTQEKYERLSRMVAQAEGQRVAEWAKNEPGNPDSKFHCPFCGTKLGTPANVRDYTPKEGDAAMCFDCGNVSMYDTRLATGFRVPTEDELELLAKNESLMRMRDIWLAARKQDDAPSH